MMLYSSQSDAKSLQQVESVAEVRIYILKNWGIANRSPVLQYLFHAVAGSLALKALCDRTLAVRGCTQSSLT